MGESACCGECRPHPGLIDAGGWLWTPMAHPSASQPTSARQTDETPNHEVAMHEMLAELERFMAWVILDLKRVLHHTPYVHGCAMPGVPLPTRWDPG